MKDLTRNFFVGIKPTTLSSRIKALGSERQR
jgi:hypothetical protein